MGVETPALFSSLAALCPLSRPSLPLTPDLCPCGPLLPPSAPCHFHSPPWEAHSSSKPQMWECHITHLSLALLSNSGPLPAPTSWGKAQHRKQSPSSALSLQWGLLTGSCLLHPLTLQPDARPASSPAAPRSSHPKVSPCFGTHGHI